MAAEGRLFRPGGSALARLRLRVVTGIVPKGIDKSMPEFKASKSGSSLVKSIVPPLCPIRLRVEDGGISWQAATSFDWRRGDRDSVVGEVE